MHLLKIVEKGSVRPGCSRHHSMLFHFLQCLAYTGSLFRLNLFEVAQLSVQNMRFAVQNTFHEPSEMLMRLWINCPQPLMLRSSKVEAVEVHHLIPRRHKVGHELLLGVLTSIDFRQSPELGV